MGLWIPLRSLRSEQLEHPPTEACYASLVTPIELIERRLTAIDEILFAYLFGSRAGGRPRPDSDWDVAVFLRDGLTRRQRFDVRVRLSADLEELGKVDVVILNDAPPLLAHRVLTGRRLLVRDKVALVRFFVKTMTLAEDRRYRGEIHLQARRRRLAGGRFGRP